MLYSIRNSLPQTTHTLIVRHLDPLNHVNFFCYISTRAPKRCDTLNTMVTLLYLHFNPRSHTRCNEAYGNFMWVTQFQPAHPLRVRPFRGRLPEELLHFNPRTHKRCDVCTDLIRSIMSKFQPAHPLRVRRLSRIKFSIAFYFNPHTHSGCDSAQ